MNMAKFDRNSIENCKKLKVNVKMFQELKNKVVNLINWKLYKLLVLEMYLFCWKQISRNMRRFIIFVVQRSTRNFNNFVRRNEQICSNQRLSRQNTQEIRSWVT